MSIKPKCCESVTAWLEWCFLAYSVKPDKYPHKRIPFCRDCQLTYAEKMREKGLCSHPEAVFLWEIRPSQNKSYKVTAEQVGYADVEDQVTNFENRVRVLRGEGLVIDNQDEAEQLLANYLDRKGIPRSKCDAI